MADANNCKDFILDVARAVKRIQQPAQASAMLYPTTYIRALKALNPALEFKGPFEPKFELENASCSDVQLTGGVSMLFQHVRSKLSQFDREVIYQKLNLRLTPDQRSFYQVSDGFKSSAEDAFDAEVYPTDFDHDGVEEIFIVYGNNVTSGNMGRSIALFIKNDDGDYQLNLDFPGPVPDAVTAGGQRYPDLIMNGPGFTTPVWRWNGKKYVFYKQLDEAAYRQIKKADVAAVSKSY